VSETHGDTSRPHGQLSTFVLPHTRQNADFLLPFSKTSLREATFPFHVYEARPCIYMQAKERPNSPLPLHFATTKHYPFSPIPLGQDCTVMPSYHSPQVAEEDSTTEQAPTADENATDGTSAPPNPSDTASTRSSITVTEGDGELQRLIAALSRAGDSRLPAAHHIYPLSSSDPLGLLHSLPSFGSLSPFGSLPPFGLTLVRHRLALDGEREGSEQLQQAIARIVDLETKSARQSSRIEQLERTIVGLDRGGNPTADTTDSEVPRTQESLNSSETSKGTQQSSSGGDGGSARSKRGMVKSFFNKLGSSKQ